MVEPVMIEPAKLELDEYIATVLGEYVAKSLVWETPTWFWGPGWPLAYYPGLKRILIPDVVAVFWSVNQEVTKLALRYALGHEFAHFLQDVRHIPVLTVPWIAERVAERQGFKFSGISTSHGMQLWQRLFYEVELMERKAIKPTVKELFFPQKFFHVKYINLSTGETEHKVISEVEQVDLYKQQSEGKISIIEIKPI